MRAVRLKALQLAMCLGSCSSSVYYALSQAGEADPRLIGLLAQTVAFVVSALRTTSLVRHRPATALLATLARISLVGTVPLATPVRPAAK